MQRSQNEVQAGQMVARLGYAVGWAPFLATPGCRRGMRLGLCAHELDWGGGAPADPARVWYTYACVWLQDQGLVQHQVGMLCREQPNLFPHEATYGALTLCPATCTCVKPARWRRTT